MNSLRGNTFNCNEYFTIGPINTRTCKVLEIELLKSFSYIIEIMSLLFKNFLMVPIRLRIKFKLLIKKQMIGYLRNKEFISIQCKLGVQ